MTPLEKALQNSNKINYCDECEFIRLVNRVPYCGINGKLIHPIMFDRSIPGYGPARQCKKREIALSKKTERKEN